MLGIFELSERVRENGEIGLRVRCNLFERSVVPGGLEGEFGGDFFAELDSVRILLEKMSGFECGKDFRGCPSGSSWTCSKIEKSVDGCVEFLENILNGGEDGGTTSGEIGERSLLVDVLRGVVLAIVGGENSLCFAQRSKWRSLKDFFEDSDEAHFTIPSTALQAVKTKRELQSKK